MSKVKKAVVPAGGFGTRMLPATKVVPKELLPVVDKPLIQFIIEEIAASGIEEVILVTGRGKSSLEDHFDSFSELEAFLEKKNKGELADMLRRLTDLVHVVSVRQSYPLGLGHAVLCAQNLINDEPFAVLLPDDLIISRTPCLSQLLQIYDEYQAPVIAVQAVPDESVSQYGIISPEPVRERLSRIRDMVEKPPRAQAPSNLAIIGRYVLPPDIFPVLRKTAAGAGGEIQLTDAIRELLTKTSAFGLQYEGTRFDAGNKAGFIAANIFLGLSHPEVGDELRAFIRTLDLDAIMK